MTVSSTQTPYGHESCPLCSAYSLSAYSVQPKRRPPLLARDLAPIGRVGRHAPTAGPLGLGVDHAGHLSYDLLIRIKG